MDGNVNTIVIQAENEALEKQLEHLKNIIKAKDEEIRDLKGSNAALTGDVRLLKVLLSLELGILHWQSFEVQEIKEKLILPYLAEPCQTEKLSDRGYSEAV